MNDNKTFEEICYSFQKEMIETFNNENDIPFLLKYYLLKEIWEDIQAYKIKITQKTQTKVENEKEKNESKEEKKEEQA